jgi:glycosyltransferase involved in cell wall biosynthesis
MNACGQTICLSMIVKNEAHVIERCLESVRPIIDHWVIVDTGSTDGTQDIIRRAMADLPGTLVERPWVDFAYNRSEALKLARPNATYSLIIDADDELIIPDGFVLPELREASYTFTIIDGPFRYTRQQLVDNARDWNYAGVLHEFLYCPGVPNGPMMPLSMRRGHDGARRRDKTTASQDIAVLEKALQGEKDPFLVARYTFYLAKYYQNAGRERETLNLFLKRAELGLGDEEVYDSLINAAAIMENSGVAKDSVLALYDRAIELIPARAEARYGASRYCRLKKDFVLGYQYAEAGIALHIPDEGIDLRPWVYTYGLKEEFSYLLFYTGQYRRCLSTCLQILGLSDVPHDVHARISALAGHALTKMIDPVWGCQQAAYSSELLPLWQS